MTEDHKLVEAGPLKTLVFDVPHVIMADVMPSMAFVCAYHADSAKGGAILLDSESAEHHHVAEFLKTVAGVAGVGLELLRVKVVGSRAGIDAIKPILKKIGSALAGELCDDSGRLRAYFYTDTGRLRVGAAEEAGHSEPESKANPHAKTRVLIVDDSKTIRQLLQMLFSADPGLEVVGAAELPSQAEKMIPELRPDVITLDIHMPEMSGVDLLQRYLPKFPIPTVMISSISMQEGTEVLRALELGAVDYIQKPSFEELEHVSQLIVEKVKTAAKVRVRQHAGRSTIQKQRIVVSKEINRGIVIAIGSSTGGTEALRAIFTQLPDEIPPIVVVQHIPPVFSKAFADRMNELCPFEVKEALSGDEVLPNRILIAPGGQQMKVEPKGTGYCVKLSDDPPVNRHRPSVDYLFDSVARHIGKKSLGIILTGMGRDGAAGLLKMRQAGARTIAQDEATSVVFGMPKEAIKLGAAEVIKPLDQVAETLLSWVQLK